MDNRFWDIDILGSWIEVGMVATVMITGLIVALPAIIGYIKNRRASFLPTDKRYMKMHSRIHEFLTELRVKCRGNRAVVLQFHNGGNFVDGTSIKRFSLTHESVSIGTSESLASRQQLQASSFIEMLNLLTDSDSHGQPIATADLPDCHLKRHLETNHTLVFSMAPLKDTRGTLIMGALLVEWTDWDNLDDTDDEVNNIHIKTYCRNVESQLIYGLNRYAH